MRPMLVGCGIVLGALAFMIGVWWLLATYAFSTGDDGPTVGHHTTTTHT